LCDILHQVILIYANCHINQAAYVEPATRLGEALPMAKRFLITGVSSGFGRALAEAAISDGHIAAGTVRNDADKQKLPTPKLSRPRLPTSRTGSARSTFW
jgi:predicted Rossmann-fold nucleotide-binding protein